MPNYQRQDLLRELQETKKWDLIVIGGGATGLGIAVDGASRGYKTLLLEQLDFAKGTSSRSTKLVHGGVRYLAQGQVDLVTEALKERGRLLQNASHLVRIQSFIIPNYRWWDNLFYNVGLKAYDLLAFRLSFGKSEKIDTDEVIERLPTIETKELTGGVVYYDGQFDDSRLAINIAQSAIDHGATVLNYFKVKNLLKDDSGVTIGVKTLDAESEEEYDCYGSAIINATGVFTDEVLNMDEEEGTKMIQPSQGIHLVLDKEFLPGNDAIMIPKTTDGRVLFLVPWQGKVLVGTTDTLVSEPSLEPKPLEEEIEFLLTTANQYLTKDVSRSDVLSMFAGLRPLSRPKDDKESTKEISRSHKIIVSDSGLITITGGKWTTYRRMAQDAIKKVIELEKLPKKKCKTKELPIHGSGVKVENTLGLNRYGSDREKIEQMIADKPILGEKLHTSHPFLIAEVQWAVEQEMARTIEDVLARRVRLLFLDARAALEVAPTVGEILAKELNREKDWVKKQLSEFQELANQYILK